MLKYLKQNKNIFIVALGLFIASMSTLLFILSGEKDSVNELKTNVVDSITLKSHQEEERNYRELIDNHDDPIIVLSLDGTIEFASWDFEANSGYRQKELKEELFFSILHPEDLGTFMTAFGKVLETENSITMIGPYRLRDGNGEYHVHMGSVHPLKEHDKVVKIGVTTRDISYEIEKNEDQDETAQPSVIIKKKSKNKPVIQPKTLPSPPDEFEPANDPDVINPLVAPNHSKKLSPLKKDEPDWIKSNRLVMNDLW